MTLTEIQRLLNAVSFIEHDMWERNIETVCGADLLSDVLAYVKEQTLLLTGLIHPQVVRTAEMLDLRGVVFVRGKQPTLDIIELAQSKNIPLFSTSHPMFLACGILYQAGLKGNVLVKEQSN
jgi:predicted transcriptional regulator